MKITEQYYLDLYIDYRKNFFTIRGYADYHYIDYNDAEYIINKGREIYQNNQPFKIEKIKCGNKVMFAVFPANENKYTIKLNLCEVYNTLYQVIANYKHGFYKDVKVNLLDAKENNKIFIKPLSADNADNGEWVEIKELQLI